jgi:hypothetical protein
MKLTESVIKSLITNSFSDGRNVYGKCPWCGEMEFGISLKENHLYGCFRKAKCGQTGNIFKLLSYIGRTDLLEKESSIDIKQKLNISLETTTLQDHSQQPQLDLSIATVSLPIGFKRTYSHPYLDERGFTQYDKYIVGESRLERKLKDYIICAIEREGEIKGYVARYTKPIPPNSDIRKYRNSKTDFIKLLFGYDQINSTHNTAIIVEGIFDKWNIDLLLQQLGITNIAAVATFGAKVSKEQIQLLKNKHSINHIILLQDPDVINKTKKYAAELLLHFDKVEVGYVSNGKDAGEIGAEDLRHILSTLQSAVDFFSKKVQILRIS